MLKNFGRNYDYLLRLEKNRNIDPISMITIRKFTILKNSIIYDYDSKNTDMDTIIYDYDQKN